MKIKLFEPTLTIHFKIEKEKQKTSFPKGKKYSFSRLYGKHTRGVVPSIDIKGVLSIKKTQLHIGGNSGRAVDGVAQRV